MQGTRRQYLVAAALCAGGIAASPRQLRAQTAPDPANYPSRPITLVVPSTAGGGSDLMGRTLAESLSKELGQTVIVDNKGGAGGLLGAQTVARAPADGYTLMFTHSGPIYYAQHLNAKMPYEVERDFAFISRISDVGLLIVANPQVPADNLPQLLAWIRKQGKGTVSYGSYGTGTVGHLLTAYLSEQQELGMTHVPYRGEQLLLQDIMGGQVSFAMASVGSVVPLIRAGRIKPIVAFGNKRLEDLPEVRLMAEEGFKEPEYEVVGGMTLLAPAGTPAPILAKLERAARAAAHSAQMTARLRTYGAVPEGTSGKEALLTYQQSQPRIAKLVRIAGVTPQ